MDLFEGTLFRGCISRVRCKNEEEQFVALDKAKGTMADEELVADEEPPPYYDVHNKRNFHKAAVHVQMEWQPFIPLAPRGSQRFEGIM